MKRTLHILIITLSAFVVYVLSYAPVVRFSNGHRLAYISEFPAYEPVDGLIDWTPLREPLLVWADIWQVRGNFEAGYSHRAEWRHQEHQEREFQDAIRAHTSAAPDAPQ